MESKDYILISLVILGIAGFFLFKAFGSGTLENNTVNQAPLQGVVPSLDTNVANAIDQSSSSQEAPTPAMTPTPEITQTKQFDKAPDMMLDSTKDYHAVIHTTDGDIKLDLFEKENPITVNNFVFLSQQGFYNNTKFHRIIKDFMIQGGDPKGNGTGGPGYQFADEPITRDYTAGTIAMANSGPNTNGSQFFIMHKNYQLSKNYVIFGKAEDEASLAVIDKIANTPTSANPNMPGENSVPTQDIFVTSVEIITK
ncbi:MAG TPA: peptidylprolyl isomerase [Candidatus Saccharimonadales bacterium]|nr:peptidylprolyl isomerase [Candidatus Saccharimonadales bacterium]